MSFQISFGGEELFALRAAKVFFVCIILHRLHWFGRFWLPKGTKCFHFGCLCTTGCMWIIQLGQNVKITKYCRCSSPVFRSPAVQCLLDLLNVFLFGSFGVCQKIQTFKKANSYCYIRMISSLSCRPCSTSITSARTPGPFSSSPERSIRVSSSLLHVINSSGQSRSTGNCWGTTPKTSILSSRYGTVECILLTTCAPF